MSTIEEKAKAYDKAAAKAIELFNSPRTCFDIDQLTEMFPELNESEDERIRQKLLECCDSPTFEIQTGIKNGVLKSWLEKQEQKHPDGCFTCDEYKKGYEAGRFNGITAGYNKAMKEQKPKVDSVEYERGFLAGQGSIQHWKPTDEQMDVLLSTIKDKHNAARFYSLSSLYNDLKKL